MKQKRFVIESILVLVILAASVLAGTLPGASIRASRADDNYVVTFYTNPDTGTITVNDVVMANGQSVEYAFGDRVHVVANPPAGYNFVIWDCYNVCVDEVHSQDAYIPVWHTGWVQARFGVAPSATFDVTFYSSPNTGTITADEAVMADNTTATYSNGQVVQVVANSPEGYGFAHWEAHGVLVDNSATPNTRMMVQNNGWIKAVFSAPYDISVTVTGLGDGVSTVLYGDGHPIWTMTNGAIFEANGVVGALTLSVDERTSEGAPDGTRYHAPRPDITFSEAGNYTFVYHAEYLFTMQSNPPEGGRLIPGGSFWVDDGSQIFVNAQPAAGYVFTGWSDGGTKFHPAKVTAPTTLTATFAATIYTIQFITGSSNAYIMADGVVKRNGATGQFAESQRVRLVAYAPVGYLFSAWTSSGAATDSSTSASTYATINGNGWIQASFVQASLIRVRTRSSVGTDIPPIRVQIDSGSYATPTAQMLQGAHAFAAPASVTWAGLTYTFASWTDDTGATLSSSATFTYAVSSARTLYVNYVPSQPSFTVLVKDVYGHRVVGATVYLDGSAVGITDSNGLLTTLLSPGRHQLTVTKAGYRSYVALIYIIRNQSMQVYLFAQH